MKEIIVPTPCLTQQEIQNYLQSNTDDEKRYRIENHLLDCPLCSAAVEGYAEHYNFEEHNDLEDLRARIDEQHQMDKAQVITMPRRRPVLARIAAAAAVLLLVAAAAWYYLSPPVTTEQLFLSYYEPTDVPGLSRVRSGSEEVTSLQKATELYRQKEYTASQLAFESLLAEEPELENAVLYTGLSALAAEDYAAAIDYFGDTRQSSPNYWEDATWYLALTYLKQGDRTMASVLLEELIQRDLPYYQERAIELKDKLDK